MSDTADEFDEEIRLDAEQRGALAARLDDFLFDNSQETYQTLCSTISRYEYGECEVPDIRFAIAEHIRALKAEIESLEEAVDTLADD